MNKQKQFALIYEVTDFFLKSQLLRGFLSKDFEHVKISFWGFFNLRFIFASFYILLS